MKDLVVVNNGALAISSVTVAGMSERRHDNVLRSIRQVLETGELKAADVVDSEYLDEQNKPQPCFILSKRAALIVMPFICGDQSLKSQIKLVDAFLAMETWVDYDKAKLEKQTLVAAYHTEVAKKEAEEARRDAAHYAIDFGREILEDVRYCTEHILKDTKTKPVDKIGKVAKKGIEGLGKLSNL